MEQRFRISAADKKHKLYGLLTAPDKKTDKVIIVVHGMTGWAHEGKSRQCVKYFVKRGWAGMRFSLYGFEDDAQTFDELTIADHARDIEQVIKYARRKGFKQICIAGHSLGWPSILLADLSHITAIVSWDGTIPEYVRDCSWGRFNRSVNGYVVDWGVRHVFGQRMKDEALNFPLAEELVGSNEVPMCLIMAEDCLNHPRAKAYCEHTAGPSKYIVIEGASHNFEEEGKEELLIRETFKWCKRWAEKR